MKKRIVLITVMLGILGISAAPLTVLAENETEDGSHVYVMGNGKTKYNDVKPGEKITGEIELTNSNDSERTVSALVAPYSNDPNNFLPVFTAENYRTTLTDWITLDSEEINIPANGGATVQYTIQVPSDWNVAGGQAVAVLFHTIGSNTSQENTMTPLESSFAHIIYMNLEGEDARVAGEIIEWGTPTFIFDAHVVDVNSKVKNVGNVIFEVNYKAEIRDIIQNNRLVWSNETTREVLPDAEMTVDQIWQDGPYFGLFNVDGEISLNDSTEKFSKWVLIIPLWFVIIVVAVVLLLIWALVLRIRQSRSKSRRLSS